MLNCNLKRNRNKKQCKFYRGFFRKTPEAQFKLVLPKRDNSKREIKSDRLRKYVYGMNKIFGGSTTMPQSVGCFIDKGKLQCEEGFVITGVRDFETPYQKKKVLSKLDKHQRKIKMEKDYLEVKKLARQAAREFGQQTVMVQFDSVEDNAFIKGKWKEKIGKQKTTDRLFEKTI